MVKYELTLNRTIVICVNLPASMQRWYVNGEIKCFSGSHIALAVLAILVLMAALIAPVLVLMVNKRWKAVSLRSL